MRLTVIVPMECCAASIEEEALRLVAEAAQTDSTCVGVETFVCFVELVTLVWLKWWTHHHANGAFLFFSLDCWGCVFRRMGWAYARLDSWGIGSVVGQVLPSF